MSSVLIPGSFDPITIGHLNIISRTAKMFSKVIVVVLMNSKKSGGLFSPDERVEFIKRCTADMPNVEVDFYDGLLADYAVEKGIGTIVKGARSATDFDYEMSLSLINRSIVSELDTVIIPTKAEYMHVSSTMVREAVARGEDISSFVPAAVQEFIEKNNLYSEVNFT